MWNTTLEESVLLFYEREGFACVYVCAATCVPGTKDKKRALNPLELEVMYHGGAGN